MDVALDLLSPVNFKVDNTLSPGDVLEVDLQLLDANGDAIDLAGTVWSAAIATEGDASTALVKKLSTNPAGPTQIAISGTTASLRFTEADMQSLNTGDFIIHVRVKDATGRPMTFGRGSFSIEATPATFT